MMKESSIKRMPIITIVLAIAMVFLSFHANYRISGTFFGKIRITDLEPYGGLLLHHIIDFEWWRLLVSNLIHVKQLHMLFNVLSLILLGWILEVRMGRIYFFAFWIVSGVIGNIVGSFAVSAPWNLGTGGSAANVGLIACVLCFYLTDIYRTKPALFILLFTLFPALVLDLIYAENHLPKFGHVVPFVVSFLFCYFRFGLTSDKTQRNGFI